MALAKNIGALAIGVSLSQFPEYSQQYVQRLGGAADELRAVTQDFDATAAQAGQTRDEALASMTGTEFLEGRQADMTQTIARSERLNESYALLKDANTYTRLSHISDFADPQIARSALEDFKPAIPLSLDSIILLLGGYVGLYGAFSGVGRVRRRFGRKRAQTAQNPDPFRRFPS